LVLLSKNTRTYLQEQEPVQSKIDVHSALLCACSISVSVGISGLIPFVMSAHCNRLFSNLSVTSGELEDGSVISILETTAADGKAYSSSSICQRKVKVLKLVDVIQLYSYGLVAIEKSILNRNFLIDHHREHKTFSLTKQLSPVYNFICSNPKRSNHSSVSGIGSISSMRCL